MASEGLIIDVDYNITKAEAKQRKLNREFERSKLEVENTKKNIDNLNVSLEAEKQRQIEIKDQIKEQVNEAANLEMQIDKVKDGTATMTEIMELGPLDAAENKLKEMEKSIKGNYAELDKSINAHDKISAQIDKQNIKLNVQRGKTAEIGDKIALNSKKQSAFSGAFAKTSKNFNIFGKRIKSLISSALLFSVITKAFTKLREAFGKMIAEQGTKTAELAAQLKGNLSIIGTTLYETAKPAIEWLLNALVKITQILATGFAKILGKSVKDMKKLAENTKKTGEEAKKATASFDTLQTIDTSSKDKSESETAVGADFSALDSEISDETAALFTIISGALLVLGVILAFSGVNIGLGIGLIAVGAVGLAASVAATWGALDPKIKKTIATLTKIISAAALVVGFILIATGTKIPLGIGLLALGAAGTVGGMAAEWNSLPERTQTVIASIMLILSSAMLVVGIILAFASPATVGFGIAMMAVGAATLVSTIAISWNSLSDKVKNTIVVISAAVSAALLVLGVVLAFSGANIGMGIGFMVAGAAGLAASLTPAWSTLPDQTKNTISAIMGIGGLLLLVIGIILCFTGAGIPLGVALIATGAAGIVGAAALNWNALTDKVKSITEKIGMFFSNCWDGIKNGFKAMVNGLISFANIWIDGLNAVLLPVRGIVYGVAKAFGSDVDLDDIKIPHIPKLATGAILPGGSPMLAWVNDQPKGQPYLEGSVENIAAAFEKYLGGSGMGNQNINITFSGSLAQIGRVLAPVIKTENKRASAFA